MRVHDIDFICKKFPELDVLEKEYQEFKEFESGLNRIGQDWPVIRDSWKGNPEVIGKISVIKQIRDTTGIGLFESKLLVDFWDGRWDGKANCIDNSSSIITIITIDRLIKLFGYVSLVKRKGRMLRPCI